MSGIKQFKKQGNDHQHGSPQRVWRLILHTGQGRFCLAALLSHASDSLPDLAVKINELERANHRRRLSFLFQPRAQTVTLAKPSQLRFADLCRRADLVAFNTEAYEAVFYHGRDDATLSRALRYPARASAAFDVVNWYSNQLSSELLLREGGKIRGSPAAKHGMNALMISEEIDTTLLMLAMALLMLICAILVLLGVGLTSKHWALDVQGGFAATEVAIAYASFVVNVYRAAMQ